MNIWKSCLAIAFLSIAVGHGAVRPPEAPQEAAVTLSSRSIRLSRAEGKSSYSVVFTTVNGSARAFGNGELRPSNTRPGSYEARYAIYDNSSGAPKRVESGIAYFVIPAVDSDGDSVPDTADRSASVNLTLSGEAIPSANVSQRVSQPNFSLSLLREADAETGSFQTDLVAEESLSGDYSVLHMQGSLTYRRTESGALLNFDIDDTHTNALATARVVDSNTVRIAAFRMRVNPTLRIRLNPTVLTRDEDTYRGEVMLSDGWDETSAPDFRPWVIQIRDLNDRDANGVPNLSDLLLPYVAVQPRRVITSAGETVQFSVVVFGTGPFTFAWEQNGHGLSNANATPGERVLVIPGVTDQDLGSYRVLVTNPAGSVYSDSTSLSFRAQ